ncbi:replication protein O [Caballeronia insecticola]|nr:replication protein O [Caballeronia insecticola]
MLIAQHSVAGEVTSRLQNPETPLETDDREALEEYACDRSNLPWVIFRAAHRANHTSALPARARGLLAALARTVDAARPYAAIFARRELLTGRAMQSMRTFYRSLDDLEKAGFITRPPQKRYGDAGLFGRAYLHLTSKSAELLGLIEPAAETVSSDDARAEQVTKPELDPSFAVPSATMADGAIYKDLYPIHQKGQPGTVPADLQRLLPLGFREFLVFKLMREAKRHGKLLSDVVEASWEHLRRATYPISYLRTLLRAPVDFAYRVRTQRVAVIERTEQRQRAEEVASEIADLRGESFVSRDGLRSYRISDDAKTIVIKHREEAQPRVHAGNWAREFLGAVRAGQIARAMPPAPEACDTFNRHEQAPTHGDLQTVQNRATPNRNFRNELNDLKQILRLKQAGFAPTREPRAAAEPRSKSAKPLFPLDSLLRAISGEAAPGA